MTRHLLSLILIVMVIISGISGLLPLWIVLAIVIVSIALLFRSSRPKIQTNVSIKNHGHHIITLVVSFLLFAILTPIGFSVLQSSNKYHTITSTTLISSSSSNTTIGLNTGFNTIFSVITPLFVIMTFIVGFFALIEKRHDKQK